MVNKTFDLAGLIVAGVIVAGLVKNFQGTQVLINGISGLWKTSINGLLGSTS